MTDDNRILQDLGELVKKTQNDVKLHFNYGDVCLSQRFQKAFADNIASAGNTIKYLKNTAIITTSAGLKIYLPNQWFVLAAYPVELIREIIKYRNYTEKIIDSNADAFVGSDGKVLDKKEIYKNLKSIYGSGISIKFKQFAKIHLLNCGQQEDVAEENSKLLYRFVTDDKWWLGGKGIERTNDFYVSPILGVLDLVNASQSYVATITYAYVSDETLYAGLGTITDAMEVGDSEENNKRAFRHWMELQVKPEGGSGDGKLYSAASIDQYISNIANTPLPNVDGKSVFYTNETADVENVIEILDHSERKNNTQRSAVRKYLQYLIETSDKAQYEAVLDHGLFGMHIKRENNALSDEDPHICIGWSGLGDLSDVDSREELSALYDGKYEKNSRGKGQDVGQIWRFLHDMNVGDYVIFAEHSVFHIGRIASDYYYDDSENPNQSSDYTNIRKVRWLKKNISRNELSDNMHHSLKTAMSVWTLNDYKSAVVDLLRGTYVKDGTAGREAEYQELIFNTGFTSEYERNRIVFGAPGTGKSYGLKEDCAKLMKDKDGSYERVTFHPDYSYSQFVGTYKPVMDMDGKSIKYDFVPGPFMRVYVEALKSGRTENPQPYLLLIEEINRAKVAAVFGDVFQLLDRDDDGVSEYEIQASEDIRRYLADKLGGSPDHYQKIRIPDNMFIWSTMNSADQGVFPMDTAFKRRWNFEYLGINEKEETISGIGKIMLAGSDEAIEWNILRRAINAKMSSEQFKINEDKLMGPFFLSRKIIASDETGMVTDAAKFIDAFKSKVIMYLYEDALKQGKHRFFDGCDSGKYSSVCDAFDEIGMGIFGPNFKENFYDKQRDEA